MPQTITVNVIPAQTDNKARCSMCMVGLLRLGVLISFPIEFHPKPIHWMDLNRVHRSTALIDLNSYGFGSLVIVDSWQLRLFDGMIRARFLMALLHPVQRGLVDHGSNWSQDVMSHT